MSSKKTLNRVRPLVKAVSKSESLLLPKEKVNRARIITYFVITEATVYLLSIYDKSEKEDISDKELTELLKFVLQ